MNCEKKIIQSWDHTEGNAKVVFSHRRTFWYLQQKKTVTTWTKIPKVQILLKCLINWQHCKVDLMKKILPDNSIKKNNFRFIVRDCCLVFSSLWRVDNSSTIPRLPVFPYEFLERVIYININTLPVFQCEPARKSQRQRKYAIGIFVKIRNIFALVLLVLEFLH